MLKFLLTRGKQVLVTAVLVMMMRLEMLDMDEVGGDVGQE